MRKSNGIKWGLRILMFFLLTFLTQVGGIIYFFSIWLASSIQNQFRGKKLTIFLVLYLFSTFFIIPFLAPLFGRVPLEHSAKIHPANYLTVFLNRNYVNPEVNEVLKRVEGRLNISKSKVKIHYLDACFPFIDGFPLFPHKSHNDGKKLDVSFVYETAEGEISNLQKSRSGYGVFIDPLPGEKDQIANCKKKGYWQYDFTRYFTFGRINKDLRFSKEGSRLLILSFLKDKSVRKIFIEPHLKHRMNLNNAKIRYHGCGAVRHDDHIHIEVE